MSRYPAPLLKRGEISLIFIFVIFILAGAPILYNRSSAPVEVSIKTNLEIDPGQFLGTPTWEIGAQKVANTCGYHYGSPPELDDLTPFFRMCTLLYHKFEDIVIFGQETYIYFVDQETRIISKLLIFNFFFSSKMVEIENSKVVIINES